MGGGNGVSANGSEEIQYSEKYFDSVFEYRHVILPNDVAKLVPRTHLLSESEWRNFGVQQSPGWINYMTHHPEPHILLFRRLRSTGIEEVFRAHVERINKIASANGMDLVPCKKRLNVL